MPFAVRYLRAPSPRQPYISRLQTGVWSLVSSRSASHFKTRLRAEHAINNFIDAHPEFALDANPRGYFVLDACDDSGEIRRNEPLKLARTLWERILNE